MVAEDGSRTLPIQRARKTMADPHWERLARVAELARDAILLSDGSGRIDYANGAAERLFGYSPGQLLGIPGQNLLAPEDRQAAIDYFVDLASDPDAFADLRTWVITAQRADGRPVGVEVSLTAWEEAGRLAFLGVARALEEQESDAQSLERLRHNFQSVVNKNQSGILVLDVAGMVRFVNPTAEQLLQRTSAEMMGVSFGVPAQLSDRREMEIVRPDGKLAYVEMTATQAEWEDEPAYLLMLHDVTHLRESEQQVRTLAYHDTLTGLANRTLLSEFLDQEVKESERRYDSPFAVLFMDLDRFKAVNDNLGHETGDRLLVKVANRLHAVLRESDTLARFGGDEFVAIVRGMERKADVQPILDRLLGAFSEPFEVDGHVLSNSITVGVSFFPDDAGDAEELVRLADTAMYQAKANPHGQRYSYYSKEMGEIAQARFELASDLAGALARDEFVLHYQPQVDLRSGKLCGFEALIRWECATRGTIGPDQFIPILEESGGILDVGDWVVRSALAQQRSWIEAGVEVVPIAVNISGAQIDHGDLFQVVERALTQHRVEPCHLVVELTESMLIDGIEHASAVFGELEALGVLVHLDDFGTGMSSLSLLRKIPLDAIKIDRSFVSELVAGGTEVSLVAGVISFAHSWGKPAIAEGIETIGQLGELIRLGCDVGQGYLFGRPVSAADVAEAGWLDPELRFV